MPGTRLGEADLARLRMARAANATLSVASVWMARDRIRDSDQHELGLAGSEYC